MRLGQTELHNSLHSRSRLLGKLPPVELVVFLCYGRSMKETKELDEDIFKEVMKVWRQEQAKMYWREVKALNKKKDLRRKKKIANVLR